MINHGLFVLTAPNGDDVGGGGTNWLSQASFDPPLIMAGVKATPAPRPSSTRPVLPSCSATPARTEADDAPPPLPTQG
ncbi:MAG: hypothetical protein GY698_06635 [Actinomycetia bacterium]|nr:hypothetical protein [Actinomycetes bacterium]